MTVGVSLQQDELRCVLIDNLVASLAKCEKFVSEAGVIWRLAEELTGPEQARSADRNHSQRWFRFLETQAAKIAFTLTKPVHAEISLAANHPALLQKIKNFKNYAFFHIFHLPVINKRELQSDDNHKVFIASEIKVGTPIVIVLQIRSWHGRKAL